jgi:hypothetical protein
MNQLEVGKSYETNSAHVIRCVDVDLKRGLHKQAICVFQKTGTAEFFSLDGICSSSFAAQNIKWPITFKPGQLVIASLGNGFDFLAIFKCMKIHESVLIYEVSNFFGDKGALYAQSVRYPTEAEWLEFREGKK